MQNSYGLLGGRTSDFREWLGYTIALNPPRLAPGHLHRLYCPCLGMFLKPKRAGPGTRIRRQLVVLARGYRDRPRCYC